MTPELPVPVAIFVALLLVTGAGLVLTGMLGLTRLGNFYQRVHAPTLGTSMGTLLILSASVIYFTVSRGSLVLHEVILGVFLTITTPVSLMLIVRAGLHRDQMEGDIDVPVGGAERAASQTVRNAAESRAANDLL